ncbi:MAG: SDR family oxidoreductase [Chromatiales bacterium]|nr:SDR family oxidoreductase [Chromatiales bacterium]
MKIAIIGATRGIGKELLLQSLAAGHEVTALARNTSAIQITSPNLHLVKGDILDINSVTETSKEQDAICICVGVRPTRKPVTVFSEGIKVVIEAMHQGGNHQQKLIVITGIGAGDSRGHGGFLYDRIINPLLLDKVYRDKDLEETFIKQSDVQWQIVRPGFLTNGPRTGKYRIVDDMTGVTAGKISRADVADYILNQLKHPTHFGKTPLISY